MRITTNIIVLCIILHCGVDAVRAQSPEFYNRPVHYNRYNHFFAQIQEQDEWFANEDNPELNQRVKQLESYVQEQTKNAEEAKKREAAAQRKAEEEKRKAAEPQWEEATNGWTHNLNGRLLGDYVMWNKDHEIGGAPDFFEFRQARIELSGQGYGVYEYRIQMDFEPDQVDTAGPPPVPLVGTVAMKDFYVGANEIPILRRLQVGHFKVPFSLQQMKDRRDLTFMERNPMADPNGFTPGREVGVASFGFSRDQRITWGYGAFFDSISELGKRRVDDNQGFTTAGRLTWTPWYDESSDGRYLLHLGLGGLYTATQDGSGRFSQRPEIHQGPLLIDTGAVAATDYTVFNPEAAMTVGPFAVESEVYWTNVNTVGGGDLDLYGGYLQGSWFLTGEHRSYHRQLGYHSSVTPYENFWIVPGCHGMGAWEVAARWSWVDFTNSPNTSRYNSLNLALNWYWSQNMRVQMNWIQPFTAGAPFGATHSSILGMRLAAYF